MYAGPPLVGVFTTCDPACHLAFVAQDRVLPLTESDPAVDVSAPSLAPDLQHVAYRCAAAGVEPGGTEPPRPAGRGSICVLAIGEEDATPQLMTSPLSDPTIDFGAPAWSPDGARLAFQFLRESGEAGIGMWAPGSDTWVVVTPEVGEVSNPAWSADGAMLAFTCGTADGETGLTTRFCVMPSGGGDVTSLGAVGGSCGVPTFMPDHEHLGVVCVAPDLPGGDLFKVSLSEPLSRSVTGDQSIAIEGQLRVVFSSAGSYAFVRRDDALMALQITTEAWLLAAHQPLHGDFDVRVVPE